MAKTIEVLCDFCLVPLETINEKRLDNNVNKKLMRDHEPNCTHWNKYAERLLRL